MKTKTLEGVEGATRRARLLGRWVRQLLRQEKFKMGGGYGHIEKGVPCGCALAAVSALTGRKFLGPRVRRSENGQEVCYSAAAEVGMTAAEREQLEQGYEHWEANDGSTTRPRGRPSAFKALGHALRKYDDSRREQDRRGEW